MLFLTRLEACDYLKISLDTLERMIKRGDLPAYKVGPRQIRLKNTDIDKYIESHKYLASK